jgi:transmembrane sensor
MDQNQNWKLMARKLAGEANNEELQELQDLFMDHPDWQYTFELLQAYWSQHPDTPPSESEVGLAVERITQPDNALSFLSSIDFLDAREPRRRSTRQRWMVGSTGFLCICLLFIWWRLAPLGVSIQHKAQVVALGNRIETKLGARSRMELPDGTTVWLNAGSILTYPSPFYSPNREVTLDGEAFFDVRKDPVHPFIVHTSSMNIKVLGTSFNIKAYAHDKVMEATLIKGSVEITRKDAPNAPTILLRPNEKLIFRTLPPVSSNALLPISSTSISNVEVTSLKPYKGSGDLVETSWVNNRLEFSAESFEDLAAKMERWYNVRISFDSDALKSYKFTGSFEKETIRQALEELKLTARFNYKSNNNDIEILP